MHSPLSGGFLRGDNRLAHALRPVTFPRYVRHACVSSSPLCGFYWIDTSTLDAIVHATHKSLVRSIAIAIVRIVRCLVTPSQLQHVTPFSIRSPPSVHYLVAAFLPSYFLAPVHR